MSPYCVRPCEQVDCRLDAHKVELIMLECKAEFDDISFSFGGEDFTLTVRALILFLLYSRNRGRSSARHSLSRNSLRVLGWFPSFCLSSKLKASTGAFVTSPGFFSFVQNTRIGRTGPMTVFQKCIVAARFCEGRAEYG